MIETIPGPDPSVVERILQERANALAVPPKAESADDALSVVVVAVGPERYGIEITRIREVQPLHGLVGVPGAPSTWAGLVNLRGSLYPVLNLRVHLGLEPGPIGSDARVVVVGDEPVEERAPVVGLWIRAARRHGAEIVTVGASGSIPTTPGTAAETVRTQLAERVRAAKRAVLIWSGPGGRGGETVAALAHELGAAAAFYLPATPNGRAVSEA